VLTTGNFTIQALGITGAVTHTPEWEANRIAYNQVNPLSVRTADTFWAGEEFILAASVTNTGTSWDKAEQVTAELVGPNLTASLSNIPAGGYSWTGTMWRDNFDDLPDGIYNFRFTVNYSNGVVKKTTVAVKIQDSIWNVTKSHRIH